ncbi:hypothetical protein PV08_00050 [Exophiala spinifera]|uniref:LysM domain-containing protein n=1 Tax=Exophiala spinifera TaxID=91928 RepID=A0A0D2BKL8_9EURO|nr:uncharacterized protein PV08_00050 [Exophiala spinifera]KIW19478.1 hypothetical protein PV08_00050 [Exophiala spinifera]
MSSNSHTGLYPSSNSSTSTLRPRAPRLISYLDDDATDTTSISTSANTHASHPVSRGVSPESHGVPRRSKSVDKGKNPRSGNTYSRPSSEQQTHSGGVGIWESWSSIQGLASTLLGGEPSGSSGSKSNGVIKKPLWMKQDNPYGTRISTPKWGPSHEPSTSAARAAIEERKAMVEAKKREALLLASVSESRDTWGRYKRRDSDVGATDSTSNDASEDALVYLHKVEKGDTLAGVIIKYNCQAEPFRKINRFWPNDNIQTRTHVLVPLAGCTARGRKVDSPYLTNDMFDSRQDYPTSPAADTPQEGQSLSPNLSNSGISSKRDSEALSITTSHAEEIDFKHDSWVLLPNLETPIEVLRVPRRALGFFPRARRKSNATLTDAASNCTPKTSFDMLRHPPTHAARTSGSLGGSPARRPQVKDRGLSGRQRSSSVTSNTFADALRGPGGVGTLRGLRTETSRPGPAEDPLNRNLAKYLPDLLQPEDMPRTGFSLRPSPRATPRPSTDSLRSSRSNSSGLGEVGGAIEGWVRKMAGVKRERGAAIGKMGDLIELETNAELAGVGINGQEGATSIEDTAEMPTPTIPTMTTATTTTSTTTTATTATEEALLNERFPIRGHRVTNAYASTSGPTKDKDD